MFYISYSIFPFSDRLPAPFIPHACNLFSSEIKPVILNAINIEDVSLEAENMTIKMKSIKQKWVTNTAIFIIGQTISLFGSMLVQYAITWHITLTTQSGVYTTVSILCGFLPNLLLSPFAGVWADRYDRKRLIILSDAFTALCTLAVALLFLSGNRSMTLLFVALALRSLSSAVQVPCVGAMLPDLVPEEHLTRANGINNTIQPIMSLVSPVVSGALLGFMPIEGIFFIDVGTAVFAILVLCFFLNVSRREQKQKKDSSYFTDLLEGVRYIGSQKFLKHLFFFCGFFNMIVAAPAFLSGLQVTRIFGGDVWRLTVLEISFGAGMVLGGVLISTWGGFKNRIHTFYFASVVMSIGTISYGFPAYFWLYLLATGTIGMMLPLFNTPAMTLLQEQVDPDYLGRVFSVLMMISSSMMPLGILIFGPWADKISIEILMIFSGAALLVLSPVLFFSKPLLEAGVKTPVPAVVEKE